jgi:hypothetical protein
LGPERTTVCCFFGCGDAWHGLAAYRPAVVGVGVVCGVVGGLWVENCIVDASILFSVVCVVVKLSRADGGCLGTRSR